jgi:hypothetical protein
MADPSPQAARNERGLMRADGQQNGFQIHPERLALAPLSVAYRPVKVEHSECVWYYGNEVIGLAGRGLAPGRACW